ncbi:MAG: hypothetical protein J6S41_04550, partial [Clostridia bacterium]|nr:hypothetical protein [Clostridia bacterium]
AERKTLYELKASIAQLKEEMFEKYRQHIEFLEVLTPGVDADAAAMLLTDNDTYAQRISDSIAELIREDYGFDITEQSAAIRDDTSADTQVFDKVTAPPQVHHVVIDDTPTQTDPVSAEDADALFESLAAELAAETE